MVYRVKLLVTAGCAYDGSIFEHDLHGFMKADDSLEKYERRYMKITRYISYFFIVLGVSTGIYNIFNSTLYYALIAFASSLIPFIPPLFFRVTGMKPVYTLTFVVDVFCCLAFTVGMVYGGMINIPQYDKFLHFMSGILFTLVGLVIYYHLKHEKKVEKTDGPQATVFCVSFSMLIAVFWEIFEYGINFILHNDPQKVAETGVNDTMQDIIFCLIGAVVFSIFMYRYYSKGKSSLLMSVFDAFHEKNMK